MHATPLHGGLGDSFDNGEENKAEKLEMTTFGKKDSKKYKGDHNADLDYNLLITFFLTFILFAK